MTAGRKPKPTALKLIQGTYRRDRANANEPKLKAMIPPCPKFLQGEARETYRKVSKKLARIGLMTEIDEMAFAMLCQSWAEYLEASEKLRETGMLVKSPNGFPMMDPYLVIANAAVKKIRALLTEFGMSPSSRCRITAAGTASAADPGSEWMDLLDD
jgi:P27 family predicted phage terminase small subunit